MKVHRIDKKNGKFTQMSNSVIHDRNLSLKARGLMVLLLSLGPKWKLNLKGLVTQIGQDGRDSVRSAFGELERCGYVVRRKLRDSKGKLLAPEYEVYEDPTANKCPQTGFPNTAKPDAHNPSRCNTIGSNTVPHSKTGKEGQVNSRNLEEDASSVIAQNANGTDLVAGRPLSDYAARVDRAMAQNLELASSRYWRTLDDSVTGNRSFKDVFGEKQQIAWTTSEYCYLKEIAQFSSEHWPEHDPLVATEAIVRQAFRKQGKARQFLRFWVEHSQSKVTLRPFLTLAGGGQDQAKRLDILLELAAVVEIKPAPVADGAS